ncbi:hypothetical protein SAMN02745157_0678 [Kaistia soli DSM 19436]|uniref:Uncharacterized protein n=1 Tax=Kaistia soli DSM 19436 TaxID=1122133 RepID=A0A1M4VE09_9HYPH|nr:hypothetical protein [Kaistia soli]SHE67093.1 hypothetical protein SAMN02745157_0678 [Kaistia soli DSM 19436]
MSARDLVDLDVYLHARGDRGVLISRTGDKRHAGWVALSHCDLAMRGDVHAVATLPRWAAIQAGLLTPRDGEEQPNLFGSP